MGVKSLFTGERGREQDAVGEMMGYREGAGERGKEKGEMGGEQGYSSV